MTGKFISLEGIEGAGKTTQRQFISDFLQARGIDLLVTREPGGTQLGEQIRDLLLAPREDAMVADAELMLIFAARIQHVQQTVLPALNSGRWVLSDRFVDASFAYQGGGRGISAARIQQLSDWSLQGLTTDLTFLFDLPVTVGQQRVLQRGEAKDRFELEKQRFFEKVRQSYLQRAAAEPNRIRLLDADQSVAAIQSQIITHLETLLDS